jgi:serine protease Do
MRKDFSPVALLGAVALLLSLSGGQALAQYARKTAIVQAVEKTRDGIITLKVTRNTDWGRSSVSGTGVIVDERGYAVTNYHVIKNAEKVVVTLSDKSTCEARVVVEEPSQDLAILRLPVKKKLKALVLGPGSDLMVGETVIAIGNPFGFANTVSTGIISALEREITMPSGDTLSNLIQTNASINPGNSGGPLVNINGELIGINVALREGAQGIAFAINVDSVKKVLRKHLSAAKVSKVTHGLAGAEKVAEEGKARQSVVLTRGRGELQKGDVLVKVGNLAVSNLFDVERGFWGHKVGDKVKAVVLREGKERTVSVTVAASEVRVAATNRKRD